MAADNRKKSSSKKRRHQKRHGARNVLIALLLVGLLAACIVFSYKWIENSSPYMGKSTPAPTTVQGTTAPTSAAPSRTAAPSPSPRASGTPQPERTRKPSSQDGNTSPEFETYEDDIYGFDCPYPESFSISATQETGVLLSLRSPDGSAYQKIFVDENPSSSPSMDMRAFVSEYPRAAIIENRAGSEYFYALIKLEDTYIYRYAAYTDGIAKGFEFGYGENVKDLYADYPADIRAEFELYD